MNGKVCVVTGGNSGIGYATAEGLAAKGARVWLFCRNKERAEQARHEIISSTENHDVDYLEIDVSSLRSIRKAMESFLEKKVDVLIHNAGVLPSKMSRTLEGHELCCATSLIGPHLLTRCLEPALNAASGRLIMVSSGGMYPVRLNINHLFNPPEPYDGVSAYAMTKRAQVILAELLNLQNKDYTACSMHPGWVDTPGVQTSIPKFYNKMKSKLRTPKQGADTLVYLATARDIGSGGTFWFDRKPRRTHFFPWTREKIQDRERLHLMLEEAISEKSRSSDA